MFSFCPKKNRTEHGPDQKISRTNFVVLIRVLNKIGRTRTCSDRSDSVGHGYLYHILYILLDFLSTIRRISNNSDEFGRARTGHDFFSYKFCCPNSCPKWKSDGLGRTYFGHGHERTSDIRTKFTALVRVQFSSTQTITGRMKYLAWPDPTQTLCSPSSEWWWLKERSALGMSLF